MSAPRQAVSDTAPPGSGTDIVGSRAAGATALRGSVMLGVSYAASIGLSLISVPLLIRHLGIAQFGRYSTVIAIVTVVTGLTDGGLFNIALREWSTRAGEDRRDMMRVLLGIRLQLTTVAVAVGVGFAAVAGYDSTLVLGTLLAGIGLGCTAVTNVLTVSLQGELRFGWASTIDIVRQAVSVALIVVLVLFRARLLAFLAVPIPAGLAMVVWAGVIVRRDMPRRPRLRDARWVPLVRDSLPYAAAIALNSLYFRVTIIVCSLVASALQTGYFATSFRVTEVLVGVPSLAIGAAFPILSRSARDDRARFTNATQRIIELALLSGVALVLTVVLSAPFVIDVLAGRAGHPAIRVLQIQGLALLATFVSAATGFALISLRRYSAILTSNCAALAVNVALTLVLVPLDEARGAAAAAVIAESSLAVTQLIILVRTTDIRPPVGLLPFLAFAGLVGASPLLIPGLEAVLRTLLGLALFVIALALVRRLPPELSHVFQRVRAS